MLVYYAQLTQALADASSSVAVVVLAVAVMAVETAGTK
jgi:hypothetical protein